MSLAAAAQIRRATIAARRQLEDMRRQRQAWLQQQYQQLAARMQTALRGVAGRDQLVSISALGPLRREAESQVESISVAIRANLDRSLGAAAQFGAAGVGAAISDDARAAAVASTLDALRAFVGADGLRLSDRIWRVRDSTRQVIVRALEQAITEGWSGIEAAQRLIGQGLPVTTEIRRAMAAAGLGHLESLVAAVLLRNQGNPLAAANRLMTTEINRAYTEAFVAGLAANDEVAGVRFLLSPRHPRVDICDLHAGVNLHGMGPGVYPLGQHPYPAHPQTLSYLEAVFGDEITDEDRAGKQTRSEWLRAQTRGVQDAILGQRKGNAWRAGKVPEFGLRTPWRVLRERLLRQGVDVDALDNTTAPPPFVPVAPTAPVSAALNLQAHKTRSRALLQLLDQVHTDGALPQIPVGDLRGAHALGLYAHTRAGDAVHVKLRSSAVLEFTLAHELGHFLDHQVLGVRGTFASAGHADLDGWRAAVMGSQAVLRWTTERAAAIAAGDRYTRDFLDYLLSPHELWARAYAQYITVRSGSPMLARQLTEPSMAGLHWTAADFDPIARAIDALLIRRGWRKP